MRTIFLFISCLIPAGLTGQNIQLHYDFRHSIDPDRYPSNFPSFSFEYFGELDSTGSFLVKLQADLNGERQNPGQAFLQASQSVRFWKPRVSLAFSYSGGLGLSSGTGYSIANSFGLGLSRSFISKQAVISLLAGYRYNAVTGGSHDAQMIIYLWAGMLDYRLQVSGSFTCWTMNRNSAGLPGDTGYGKKFAAFGDPQVWMKVYRRFSAGFRFTTYYQVLSDGGPVKCYPSVGIRQDLR